MRPRCPTRVWLKKMGPGEERRTARMINGTNGRQMARQMEEMRMEISRRTTCSDAPKLKPFVKMRLLGVRPSSSTLPEIRSIRELASSITTPLAEEQGVHERASIRDGLPWRRSPGQWEVLERTKREDQWQNAHIDHGDCPSFFPSITSMPASRLVRRVSTTMCASLPLPST